MIARTRGFTLLEVLIAIAIFAIVSAMAYAALNQVLIARDRLEAEREFWRALSMTFLRLEDDLSQVRNRGVRTISGFGDNDPAMQVRATDTRALGEPTLTLTRGGVFLVDDYLPKNEDDDARETRRPPRSDLQRVAYRLNDGKLWRITWPQLDPAPQTEPVETELLGDVEDFKIAVFDPADGRRRDSWPPGPPAGGQSPPAQPLPRGAEVSLTLRGRGEFVRLFLIHE
ncbi:MAG TPA: type II secretion system minor pseudopilin GspJ [Acidiferrobacterales bacterium]